MCPITNTCMLFTLNHGTSCIASDAAKIVSKTLRNRALCFHNTGVKLPTCNTVVQLSLLYSCVMNLSNSEFKLDLKRSEELFLLLFNSIEIIIGALLNSLVIVTFVLDGEMRRRPSDLLILNLAAADFIILTTFQPWLTYIVSKSFIAGNYYFFYEGLNTTVQLAAGNAVFLIGLDRFIAVSVPLHYHTWIRRITIYKSIALSWAMTILIGIVNFMAYALKFHKPFLVFWIGYQLFLLLSLTLMYITIFSSSYRQGRRIWQDRAMSKSEDARHRMMVKITMNTFILVCFFYATFMPVIIYITHFSLVANTTNEVQMESRTWIYSFESINCCFNPLFYVFRMERFKRVCCRFWLGKNLNNGNDIPAIYPEVNGNPSQPTDTKL